MLILGNDALLTARPATPVQLAHACLAAGYRAVVPASWGDELVAAATTQILGGRAQRPAIHCVCPHVARRVLGAGSELAPYLVSVTAPPVAAARYVRRHSSGTVRITYAGRCPAATDDSIDARLTPDELLAQLADRGIDLLAQPTIFESVIPPDRRRHFSLPGGFPSEEALRRRELTAEAIGPEDFATGVAEKVLSGTNSLLDVAPAVGCACAGALPEHGGRDAIIELEPPRAPSPVVDVSGAAALELPVAAARTLPEVAAVSRPPAGAEPVVRAEMAARPLEAAVSRRRSGPLPRLVPGNVPLASDPEGRVLPRSYVAHRRSPRSGIPLFKEPPPPPAPHPAALRPDEPPSTVNRDVEPSAPEVVRAAAPAVPAAPAAAPVAPPIAAERPASPAPAIRERVQRGWQTLSASHTVTLALLLGVAGLLVGVAIGWAAGRRAAAGGAAPNAAEVGRRIGTESAGRVAPAPRATPQRDPSAPAPVPPRRGAARGVRSVGAPAGGRAAVEPEPAPGSAASDTRVAATDTAAAGQRDSARQAAAARAESLVAERQAIARELETRRARLDSLARRVSELTTAPPRPSTPPRR